MSAGFARYLPQFSVSRPGDPAGGNDIFFAANAKKKEGLRDVVAEAEERGRAEAKAAAAAEAERVRVESEAAFERRLAEQRRQWTEGQADVLTTRIAEGLRAIETRLSADVARILTPFLEAAVRRKALDEIVGTLREILTNSRSTGLTITGPEDLLAVIRGRLGADAAMLTYVVDEAPDIRIEGEDTAIETQLRAWVERLRQAAAEA